MLQVILTKGLPGSGKTTWAKTFVAEKLILDKEIWKRVNKDDLRAMMDANQWSKENEAFILSVRDYIITMALLNNYNVIVDDTNLHPKHVEQIQTIVTMHNDHILPKQPKCELIIKDFTDVPLETCIERDAKRERTVGEAVIRDMHERFLNANTTRTT
jgi:tRNA uridine 5-carbamoylmethylation protein Kti12